MTNKEIGQLLYDHGVQRIEVGETRMTTGQHCFARTYRAHMNGWLLEWDAVGSTFPLRGEVQTIEATDDSSLPLDRRDMTVSSFVSHFIHNACARVYRAGDMEISVGPDELHELKTTVRVRPLWTTPRNLRLWWTDDREAVETGEFDLFLGDVTPNEYLELLRTKGFR